MREGCNALPFYKENIMPIIKFPPSISDREALMMIQGQGFTTIVSITHTKDGSKLIEAK